MHSRFDRIDFDDVVKEAWLNLSIEEEGSTKSLHDKLKGLKIQLKLWYSRTKEAEYSKKKSIMSSFRSIEEKIDAGCANDKDRALRVNRLQELDGLEKLESMDLVEKARIKWESPWCRWRELGLQYGIVAAKKRQIRPISLIGVHYKIVSRILANRLSKVIGSIISQEQSAFTSRQILVGPLILSEVIDWLRFEEFRCVLTREDSAQFFNWLRFDQDSSLCFDQDSSLRFDQDSSLRFDQDSSLRFDQDSSLRFDQDSLLRFDEDSSLRFDDYSLCFDKTSPLFA
ncbi:hypothetical protein Tco_0693190 [Tanacetum coccineum]